MLLTVQIKNECAKHFYLLLGYETMNILFLTLLFSTGLHQQPSTRNLLLFGKGEAAYTKQLDLLQKDSAGMAERHLAIIIIEKDSDYKKYNVEPNRFTLILIGKDEGEKLRSAKPVEIETIFNLVDSMPMRQAEMKSKEN
jgi:hypothetical protein